VNGKPIGDRAVLAGAARAERVLCDVRRSLHITCGHEGVARRDDARIELGALFHVGLDEELTAGGEKTRDLRQEDVPHHESLLMALLPPRVGEVEKHAPHACVWTKSRQGVTCIFTEDACVGAEAMFRETTITHGRPLASDLEADEERLRYDRRALEEEPGFRSGPDLELDPLAFAKLPEIDGLVPLR
jgi:hypothetical protein